MAPDPASNVYAYAKERYQLLEAVCLLTKQRDQALFAKRSLGNLLSDIAVNRDCKRHQPR